LVGNTEAILFVDTTGAIEANTQAKPQPKLLGIKSRDEIVAASNAHAS
jgi:hypothetical protein